VPEHLRGHLALFLREEVHVAIVVVAGVEMIEVRQRAGLAGRTESLVVPVGDHDLAVGIERRLEQQDDVVEDFPDARGVAGGEVVDQLDDHLGSAYFGGVNVVGDENDRFAGAEDLVAFGVGGRAALEVELAFEGLDAVEVAQVIGRTDFHEHERIAAGGGTEIAEADPVAVGGDVLHVLDDLVPADEFLVAADAEAEVLFGGLDRSGGGKRGDGQGEKEATHLHGSDPEIK